MDLKNVTSSIIGGSSKIIVCSALIYEMCRGLGDTMHAFLSLALKGYERCSSHLNPQDLVFSQ